MQPSGGPQVGQTRPGRLGDPQPGGGGASTAAAPGDAGRAAGDPRKFVDQEIASHKAVVFSKVLCPSSRKAKEIMASHSAALPAGQLEVVELDQRPDGGAIQDALKAMTGKHTVPVIFLGGQFVGGADQLAEMEASGQLEQRLRA